MYTHNLLIKVNRRTCLGEDTLDRLIRINVEGPPLSKWDANGALELWQKDKVRRVNCKDTQNQGSTSFTFLSMTGKNGLRQVNLFVFCNVHFLGDYPEKF